MKIRFFKNNASKVLMAGLIFILIAVTACDGGGGAGGGESPSNITQKPYFNPQPGSFDLDQNVEIKCASDGAKIYYVLGDGDPSESSTLYNGTPIDISGDGNSVKIRAIAVKEGMENSSIAEGVFTINYNRVSTPQFTPDPGVYKTSQTIRISCQTPGALIYYTTNGTVPAISSTYLYNDSNPIVLSGHNTKKNIRAIAVKSGMQNSTEANVLFEIDYAVGNLLRLYGDAGSATSIAVNGNYCYLACGGGGLKIFDITDPSNPVYVKSVKEGNLSVGRIFISGNYLYNANANDLQVFDVSNATEPVYKGKVNGANGAKFIYIEGNYLYARFNSLYNDHLIIFDITNPIDAVKKGDYQLPDTTSYSPRDLYVSGNYAYLAEGDDGLFIVDVTDKNNPVQVCIYQPETSYPANDYTGVSVNGNYAYLADKGKQKIEIINISIPETPVRIKTITTGALTSPDSLFLSNNILYVGTGADGIAVFDVSDPENPVTKGTNNKANGLYHRFAVKGSYLLVADSDNGLSVLNVSNLSTPSYVANCDTSGYAKSVSVAGDYAYIADGDNGLIIADVSDPVFPVVVSKLKLQQDSDTSYLTSNFLFVSGNYVYVVLDYYGFKIIDVSDPAAPVITGVYKTSGGVSCKTIFVSGNYAYLSATSLHIVNISNKSNPVIAKVYSTGSGGGSIQDAYIYGNYTYLAKGSKGIEVLDITNKSAPVSKGTFTNTNLGYAKRISLSDNYAYIADDYNGLVIFDVSTPAIPVYASKVSNISGFENVFINGNYAYCRNYAEINIFDISDPSNPLSDKSFSIDTSSEGLFVDDEYIYLTGSGNTKIVTIFDK